MDYVGILVTILSIIIALLIALWGTYPLSKKNKKVIRIRIKLSILLLIIFIVAISVFYILNKKSSLDREFSQMFSEFHSLMDEGNYLDALITIDKMLNTYKEDGDKVYMLTYEKALCCLMYGSKNNNESFIDKTIQILSSIKNVDNKSLEDYQNDIRVMLGYSYLFLNDPIYKSKLEDLVWEIENKTTSIKNLDCVYYFLGSYYYNMFENSGELLYLEKAKTYYGQGIDVGTDIGNLDLSENLLYSLMLERAGYCCMKYGVGMVYINDDESIIYIQQAAEIYETLLNTQDPKKDLYQYFYYKKELARCYFYIGLYSSDNDLLDTSLEYMENIIDINEEIIDDHLVGLIPLYVTLKKYDEVNVEMIIERYNRLLEKYTVSTNLDKAFNTRTNLVLIYHTFADRSGIQAYYESGERILNELKDVYYPLVNSSQKEYIDSLEDWYSG